MFYWITAGFVGLTLLLFIMPRYQQEPKPNRDKRSRPKLDHLQELLILMGSNMKARTLRLTYWFMVSPIILWNLIDFPSFFSITLPVLITIIYLQLMHLEYPLLFYKNQKRHRMLSELWMLYSMIVDEYRAKKGKQFSLYQTISDLERYVTELKAPITLALSRTTNFREGIIGIAEVIGDTKDTDQMATTLCYLLAELDSGAPEDVLVSLATKEATYETRMMQVKLSRRQSVGRWVLVSCFVPLFLLMWNVTQLMMDYSSSLMR